MYLFPIDVNARRGSFSTLPWLLWSLEPSLGWTPAPGSARVGEAPLAEMPPPSTPTLTPPPLRSTREGCCGPPAPALLWRAGRPFPSRPAQLVAAASPRGGGVGRGGRAGVAPARSRRGRDGGIREAAASATGVPLLSLTSGFWPWPICGRCGDVTRPYGKYGGGKGVSSPSLSRSRAPRGPGRGGVEWAWLGEAQPCRLHCPPVVRNRPRSGRKLFLQLSWDGRGGEREWTCSWTSGTVWRV